MKKVTALGKKTNRKSHTSAGNTSSGCDVFRARHFQLTINETDKYEKIKNYLMGKKNLNYFISCLEKAPSTGKEHIHIYIQFTQPFDLRPKKVYNCHIEKCKGTPQQNQEYIKKDGNIIDEWGEMRSSGSYTIENVKKMSKVEREELPINYYNIVQKINTKENNDINIDDIFKELKVFYIFGESGVGKTKKAMEMFKENGYQKINMVKYENGFWNGIGNAKACLYDDFRDSHMKPSEFINFIDYNKHQLNTKGGYELNNYEFIIITSVQNPEEIYKNVGDEPRRQWIRRMKRIQIFGELGQLNKVIFIN